MYAQQISRDNPNHRCPNCGHTFGNIANGAQRCYRCGEVADSGEEAGLQDEDDYDNE